MNEITLKTKNSQELNKALQLYRKTKDQDIIAQLYTSYIPLIFGLCMKYYKNEENSKDAVISIYELVQEKLKTQQIHHFHSWIYVVSKNYILQQLRKHNQDLLKEKHAHSMYYELLMHPDTKMKDELIFSRLEQCMDQLIGLQARCIDRFYFDKFSYAEIAKELGLTWDAVRSHIQNGRRNLKKCMEKNA